ncbi:hypothetical protein ACHAWF_018946 [Thalassiosira exigua]
MTYGNIKLAPWSLKLTISDIVLLPSRSSLVQSIMLSLFQSASVRGVEGGDGRRYPESKVTVQELVIKVRISSQADPTKDGDPCTPASSSHPLDVTSDGNDKGHFPGYFSKQGVISVRHFIPHLIVVVKLSEVSIDVEKAYVAPEPPSRFRTASADEKFPAAIPPYSHRGEIVPTFYQDLDAIENEEIAEAERVTDLVCRWLDHVSTKMKKGKDAPIGLVRSLSFNVTGSDNASQEPELTPDERMNAWIRWAVQKVLHSISFKFQHASVAISGAGAEMVKRTREQCSSSEANMVFARLPRERRALTVVGADEISLTFSPDEQCNALFCFVGLHTKVGNPVVVDSQFANDPDTDVAYAWHMVAHPFHLVTELKGVLPFVIWAVNYDHDWRRKSLGFCLSASEIAVSLSPDHLHTVFLHLDDYIDPLSPYNEWQLWLKNTHRESLEKVREEEKAAYVDTYAIIKNLKADGTNKTDSEKESAMSKVKKLDRRLNRYELMSLRSFAMKDSWRIPKANEELEQFLQQSRSTICDKGDERRATQSDGQTSFQRLYPTPQHALVALIRDSASLCLNVSVESSVQTLHIDFCGLGPRVECSLPSIPSSITVSDVSFGIGLKSIVFLASEDPAELDCPRPFVDISLQLDRVKWDVIDDASTSLRNELPGYRDRSPIGIIYMSEEAETSKHVISLDLSICVIPTADQDFHFGLAFKSSDLILVINPLPILSAIADLIELVDLPYSPDGVLSDGKDFNYEDDRHSTTDDCVTPFGTRANVSINVENTKLLFLVDRVKVNRGILHFDLFGFNVEFESGGMSGKCELTAEPAILCAGQISHQLSSQDGTIDCPLMPHQPIIDLDGAEVTILGEEDLSGTHGEFKEVTTTPVRLCVKAEMESVLFNASPSTIVAVFGAVSSLGPFMDWLQGEQKAREEEQRRLEDQQKKAAEQHVKAQREVLLKIFKEIDVDSSGELSEDELNGVILQLFDKSSDNVGGGDNPVEKLTESELERERYYLLSIMDPNRSNEISFQELDTAFFKIANRIDDENLTPQIKDDNERAINDHYKRTDEFLSGPWLRQLIYFDNMREYSSMSEVYNITGQDPENDSTFLAPSLWRQGSDSFWDLYTKETGCTRASLNGQCAYSVQRKLVRSLCNYNFAKFCWKTLVQPELNSASGDNEAGAVTHWLLDKDSTSQIRSGVIERLLKHVHTALEKEMNSMSNNTRHVHCDAKLDVVVGNAVIRFGSSHSFANPLFEATFADVSMNATTLMSSQTGWFVAEAFDTPDATNNENQSGNRLRFQSSISATYLNTKHNHMECFIEPYPCFGNMRYTYTVFAQDASVDDRGESSFSIHLNCPRFLNMNTSRSFFETASVLTKVLSQSDPETFRSIIFRRDASYVRSFWNKRDRMRSGFLSRSEVLDVLHSVAEMHWKDEMRGLTPDERHHFLVAFLNLTPPEEDGTISLESLISAFKFYTARCYFTGSREILIKNDIGRVLKASTKESVEDHLLDQRVASESDFLRLLGDVFLSTDDGSSCAIPLSGRLCLHTKGYKMVDDIRVSPYQTLMFPLKRQRRGSVRRRRRHTSASGFSPFITVVPKSDSLDNLSLNVRTSVYIRTDIPVGIRIVRIGKAVSKFRAGKKDTSNIDLGKKNLMAALKRVVEGAPIVYEKHGINEGDIAPLPLDVLESSHYHALLIQWNNSWRDPVLLTKDFLFNPTNLRQVSRCHALSGIAVHKERLNLRLSDKHRNTTRADNKSILKRTAWDVAIQVMPFFLLSNALPFPIIVRTWQVSKDDEDELWDEPLILDNMDDDLSSDEEQSTRTPSIKYRRVTPDDIHVTTGSASFNRYSEDHVAIGQTVRLSGVTLGEPLFLQVSQHVNASEDVDFLWTNPLQVELPKLKTGINPKGIRRLPKLILDLGDNCDCLVDVTAGQNEGELRAPVCTIYSPYWFMNKTGSKLEYRVAGQSKSYLDSGSGGLPVMIHGSKSESTNEKYTNVSKAISVIPIECPSREVLARNWWDESTNGPLVFPQKCPIEGKGHNLVDWSEDIDLDEVGTSKGVFCRRGKAPGFIFNVKIDSLAGAFHRSNLVSFTPRFVVKNLLHISISILPIYGGDHDAMRKASQLRQGLKERDERQKINVGIGESTALFNFQNVNTQIETPRHWVAFCVNASRYGANFKSKWHLIPLDRTDTHNLGEHDGCYDTMCAILQAKVQDSEGSMVVSISHAPVPPFRIENRSNTHFLRFAQDDAEAVVFELPPMMSCAYTWDSPMGKQRLRAVVIPKSKSKKVQVEEAFEIERENETSQDENVYYDGDAVTLGDESIKTETTKKGSNPDSRELNKTARYRSPRKKAVTSLNARGYDMLTVGAQTDLPCPSSKESAFEKRLKSSHLFAHTRIVAGTKILSFSDSSWYADQVKEGILRKGGNFKSALFDVNIVGFGLYVMDDFPCEVMSVVVRDMQLHKQPGSIEFMARARHFQVDAMLPNARYPIIIQPVPAGVDRREPLVKDSNSFELIVPDGVSKSQCFWNKHDEKPIPFFEVRGSYVPQSHMTWIPSLNISICPLKMYIDVEYILQKVVSMVMDSVNKYQGNVAKNLTATSSANDKLKYLSGSGFGSNVCMTYIERLDITETFFDIELNIKSDDPERGEEGDTSVMTLHSLAQTTNSAAVAGIFSWVINVGANFAHVSPTFRYPRETYSDEYCDLFDLLLDIVMSYVMQSVKQGYKVVFSMQILGDPSKLAYQYKTGVKDLFTMTKDEVGSGGKDGIGKGVSSLLQNVVGGTFFAFGKVTGGVADTIDSVLTNDMTSNHLKPKSASSDGRPPDNAVEGVAEGAEFFAHTMVHGIAGLVGNPYRGMKTGTASGVAKGVVSGVGGIVTAPFVGALGFVAKTADGIGATTKYLDLSCIEARCRPARMVSWGTPMSDIGLSYLKAIGIRVHTVRYQKVRRRLVLKDETDQSQSEIGNPRSKENKRIRKAEERRKNPPRKSVSIMHGKEKYHHVTGSIRPKLLTDAPGNLVVSHYAVTFEETLIIRSSDLQLNDTVVVNFWNDRGLKSSTTRAKPLGVCKFSVGDIYSSMLHFFEEQLKRKEANLSSENIKADSLITPAIQECPLFRPYKREISEAKNIFDAINEEMAAIKKSEEDKFLVFDSESSEQSDSDSSFLDGGEGKVKPKEEDPAAILRANERLFGSISLSFFPIPW